MDLRVPHGSGNWQGVRDTFQWKAEVAGARVGEQGKSRREYEESSANKILEIHFKCLDSFVLLSNRKIGGFHILFKPKGMVMDQDMDGG